MLKRNKMFKTVIILIIMILLYQIIDSKYLVLKRFIYEIFK